MSRLADALAALRDAAEAIAPAAVDELREHNTNVLRVIFGDWPHRAPQTIAEACKFVRAIRIDLAQAKAEVDNLRAEVAALRAKGTK